MASAPPLHVGPGTNFVYINHLPRMDRKRLSDFLDQDAKWVGLALQMNYSSDDIEDIRRCCSSSGESPAKRLLTNWGRFNHTITELFVVLAKERHFTAMESIKRFVEPRFHILIEKPAVSNSAKLLNAPQCATNPTTVHSEDQNEECAQQRAPFVQTPSPATVKPTIASLPSNDVAGIVGDLPQFDYAELCNATDNWSPSNELGKGGFGVVYKGWFKNTLVAIKKIKGQNTESARTELRQSFNELKYLKTCLHENVVQLLGCSIEFGEPCLVYQFMRGGSLDKRLAHKQGDVDPLSLDDRIKIAKGTARGLQYLHTFAMKPIIHGDIKPGNILLDKSNEPKIGDFGFSRVLMTDEPCIKVTRVFGTRRYIPHEFEHQRQLSTKVDCFSYGIVLYELATGKRVYDEKRSPPHLKDYIAGVASSTDFRVLIDPLLSREDDKTVKGCMLLIRAGFCCTVDDPKRRSNMVDVYKFLTEHWPE
ncbi:serine/threonine-protein kinase pelle-like [Toxorhynchites rutilus septentrionalis]|uniref:serine/threonine-protein kinase pelle-like n=1 Tax=Toxorhynchites rutilus septentrionalis TaxID=329112 RepID=UPI0024789FDD|nr:serine/threonine-protein kinase pelle-like [Toxorhynchites rutilus septentrionalis]XP_055638544.1 serine/threonine-protein kinase pelle-like [Toxorhynchites rutilus septentrionalis]